MRNFLITEKFNFNKEIIFFDEEVSFINTYFNAEASLSSAKSIVFDNYIYTFGVTSDDEKVLIKNAIGNYGGVFDINIESTFAGVSHCRGAGLVRLKDYLFVVGGYDNNVITDKITQVNPVTLNKIVHRLPFNIANAGVFVVNNKLCIAGGLRENDETTDVVYEGVFENGSFAWRLRSHRLPYPVRNNTPLVKGSRVYLIGGIIDDSTSNKMFYTDLNKGRVSRWYEAAGNLPFSVSDALTFEANNRVYLIDRSIRNKIAYAHINQHGCIPVWFSNAVKVPLGLEIITVPVKQKNEDIDFQSRIGMKNKFIYYYRKIKRLFF
jgi:N-acetylneuraminic acid mutarotase